MAFPQTPVELLAEMQIGGVWTDITSDMYTRAPLTIQRGRQDEGQRVDASTATFQLDNRQNKYSPKNPRSANYKLIGRNTPVRVSVAGSESYLATTGATGDNIATPDHASLDIVGDIDARVELTAHWTDAIQQTMIGKWSVADGNRSWVWRIINGQSHFVWSPTGLSAGALVAIVNLPALPHRAALRATLDVDNGAGGWTGSVYWATSLDGPWTLAGTATGTGTTSIFSGTAPLEIAPTQFTTAGARLPWRGRLHRAEVRSSIGGTAVANPDVRAKAVGTTSWTDAAGRTWTVAGAAAVTNREYRLHAEVSSWPPRWDVSGRDVYVPIEASGILRRLGQGAKALASTLRRRLPSQNPVAYWPMEEGRNAVQAYSPLATCQPLSVTGFTFGADDTCPGSSALPSINAAAALSGPVPIYTSPSGGYLVSFLYSLTALPASDSVLLAFSTSGTAGTIVLTLSSDGFNFTGYSSSGSVLFNNLYFAPMLAGAGKWFRVDISAQTNAGNTDFHVGFVEVDGGGISSNFSISGTPGTVTSLQTAFGALLSDMKIGHVAVFPSSDLNVWGGSDNGYGGEAPSARILRLATEESVPAGSDYAPTPLGAQRPGTLLALLDECAAADGGVLYEDRDRIALRYRSRTSYYNQPIALTLNYETAGEVAPPLEPVDDDQRVRNDRTVTRIGGSSARAVAETGPMSVQAPPNGVGIYDDTVNLSLDSDSQPQPIADWLLHLGTWDEARYPTVHINLAAAPHLIPAVLALDIGDRIQIINPPAWLPPGPIDLIVEGYTEVIGHPSDWDIVLNCSPAGPWSVAVADSTSVGKADTTASTLGAAATNTATTLLVDTTQDDTVGVTRWAEDPAEYPFNLEVGGEVVTATAGAPYASDTFTRTVSNGWGTSSSGLTWGTANGSASDRSVASNRGVVTLATSPSTLRFQVLPDAVGDCEIRCALAVGATATGASLTSSIVMRYTGTSDYYRLRLQFTTAGTIVLSVHRDATQIDASVTPGVSYGPGDLIQARVRLIGHRVLARVWASTAAEPILWHIDRTITTSTIVSGQVGIAAGAVGGNTNVSPEIRTDDFVVVGPQRMTVTRSVNGIVKAQAAGEDVRLAQPAVAAL
ncbi:hypothetical protein ACFXD5_06595 [Streptomyces sp. NPDC059385]|uniref:hypothetical protein n=1 Tax=Streptomyces sp. NPDC059385 TaxID=3346817 RepID=UPI0036B5C750